MFVFVVYQILKNTLDAVEVFENYDDAKWFVNHTKGKFRIWQRPLIRKIEYVNGEMTVQY